MTPTAELRKEHRSVVAALGLMRGMAGLIQAGRASAAERMEEDIRALVNFLSVYVGECHHAKEELVLFPFLLEMRGAGVSTLVERLAEEHAQGRGLVAELSSRATVGRLHLNCQLLDSAPHQSPSRTYSLAAVEQRMILSRLPWQP